MAERILDGEEDIKCWEADLGSGKVPEAARSAGAVALESQIISHDKYSEKVDVWSTRQANEVQAPYDTVNKRFITEYWLG
ncbi:MAG: hypothetical protein ABI220_01060 [Candidatus Saccharimonadales bacterium]